MSHGNAKLAGSSLVHPQGRLTPLQADITSKPSIRKLVQQISQEHHVDVLVNNAVISEGASNVEKAEESAEDLAQEQFSEDQEAWEDVYRTNVTGYFFTTAAFLPLLRASTASRSQHTASVINISSILGITRTTQHHFKYNVSKAATIHLNTLLAQGFRKKAVNVRVNSIAPGIFPSEMTTEGSDEVNKSQIPVDEQYGAKKGIPAGRSGGDEDMGQAALFLACNQYAFGQTIAIDGGYLLEHP